MSSHAGTAIKAWRTRNGLTQAECAKRISVTQSAWNQWENGLRDPQVRLALRLADLTEGEVPITIWGRPLVAAELDESGPLPTETPAATGTHNH